MFEEIIKIKVPSLGVNDKYATLIERIAGD